MADVTAWLSEGIGAWVLIVTVALLALALSYTGVRGLIRDTDARVQASLDAEPATAGPPAAEADDQGLVVAPASTWMVPR